MKLGKIVLSAVAVIIIVAAAVIWYLLSNISSIAKDLIETEGSKVLQTSVLLDNVNIKLLDGSAQISQFSIANYAGFSEPTILAFDTIKIDIEPRSLDKDVIVLDEVTVSGARIVAEQKGLSTNIQTLLKKQAQYMNSAEDDPNAEPAKEILIAIKKLNFVGNSLSLATEDYGKHSLDLPTVTQTNLGSASKGLAPKELAVAVLKPLLEQAQDKIEEGLIDLAEEKLKEKYGERVEQEKQKLKSKIEDELGVSEDEVKEKLDALKKLF